MNPIQWQGDHVMVLDQRKLPATVEWLRISTALEMAEAIRNMALRGAPLIGIAAGYGLALEAGRASGGQKEILDCLEKAAKELQSSRPTAVNLFWALQRLLRAAGKACEEKKSVAEAVVLEAKKIHEEDRLTCSQIGKFGANLLSRGGVLTHCNTGSLATGGEGTAYAAIKEGFRAGKISHVYACEARPYLQGARLTAFELKEDQIPFTLITDSMAGYFMTSGKIASVFVGADRIAANGDTANKIGTYSLAVLANENRIPFYVAAPVSTLDLSIPTGQRIPIEERNPEEVTEIMGIRIAPSGTHAANPAFDVTPAAYVKAIITEKGVALPPFSITLARLLKEELSV